MLDISLWGGSGCVNQDSLKRVMRGEVAQRPTSLNNTVDVEKEQTAQRADPHKKEKEQNDEKL